MINLHIIVGMRGRVLVRNKKLEHLKHFILDECDEMLIYQTNLTLPAIVRTPDCGKTWEEFELAEQFFPRDAGGETGKLLCVDSGDGQVFSGEVISFCKLDT